MAYVAVWWQAVDDFTRLLEKLGPEEWATPTDLPGWDVRACVAHTAHLEAVLAGAPEETVQIDPPAHARGMMGHYTEQGIVARADRSTDELIAEIREATTARHTALLADPPEDGSARPERIFGGVPWSWETLLRNRPLDVWMHEQDVRRATGRPGGMDSPAGKHTADYLLESLPFVLAKRAGAPPGTTVRVEVEGSDPVVARVGDDGRGTLADASTAADATLRMGREAWIVLAGGRRTPSDVEVSGDEAVARLVLANAGVTP